MELMPKKELHPALRGNVPQNFQPWFIQVDEGGIRHTMLERGRIYQ